METSMHMFRDNRKWHGCGCAFYLAGILSNSLLLARLYLELIGPGLIGGCVRRDILSDSICFELFVFLSDNGGIKSS